MAGGKAPGKSYRNGTTLTQLFDMYPDEAAVEAWFAAQRWPEGMRCLLCDSVEHPVGEYVRGMAHTNGIESHWALLKCGLGGT